MVIIQTRLGPAAHAVESHPLQEEGPLHQWRGLTASSCRKTLFSGWWLSHPPEKYERQLGGLFPIYGKIKMFQTTNQFFFTIQQTRISKKWQEGPVYVSPFTLFWEKNHIGLQSIAHM